MRCLRLRADMRADKCTDMSCPGAEKMRKPLYSYGNYIYGLYGYGLYSYSYGLRSYGL